MSKQCNCKNDKSGAFYFTLNHYNPFIESISKQGIFIKGNFQIKVFQNQLLFFTDQPQVTPPQPGYFYIHDNSVPFAVMEFGSEEAAEEALSYFSSCLENWGESDEQYPVHTFTFFYESSSEREEIDQLVSERKQLWEECDCQGEEGCEKCLKNPKFDKIKNI